MSAFRSLLALTVFLSLTTPTIAATYYVRTGGDDSNDGSSSSTAFKTIKRAAQFVASGDIVYVGAGTYDDDVHLDGIQQSTSLVEFYADASGSQTGDSGTVTFAGQLNVTNSNYVKISGFDFSSSTTDRLLVWQGSYEGLIEHCTFSSGGESLLIKDGSLTIDNCQLQNFSQDGIQIDGEADVTISNSSITNSSDDGIAILKNAKVTLDNTDVTGSSGVGISVAVSGTYVPTGGPAPLCVGIDDVNLDGSVDSYNSSSGAYPGSPGTDSAMVYSNDDFDVDGYIHGSAYHTPGNSVSSGDVSGSVVQMDGPLSCARVDENNVATVNNNSSVPLTDFGNDPLVSGDFTLGASDGIDLPPGVYYFSTMTLSGGAQLRLSGATSIYCTGQVSVSASSIGGISQDPTLLALYPLQGNCTLSTGATVYGAVYGPTSDISIDGSSDLYGIAVGKTIYVGSGSWLHTDLALSGLAGRLHRTGTAVATTAAPPATWTAIAAGELSVSNSTLDDNFSGVSLQDPWDFTAQSSTFENSDEWGLRLKGTCQLDACTVQDNTIGGIELDGMTEPNIQITNLTLANNTQYGLYANNSQLSVDVTDSWSISGGDYGFAIYSGGLTLDGLTINGPATACVLADQTTLTVQNSTLSGSTFGVTSTMGTVLIEDSTLSLNSVGVHSNQDDSMTTRNTLLHDNSTWAAVVMASTVNGATATFDGCTIYDNAGGVTVSNALDGDFELLNTVIRDNSQTGINFQSCTLTVSDQATDNWQTLRNLYGISANSSTVTLTDVTVSEASSFALVSFDSTLTIQDCLLTGGDGFYQTGNSSATINGTRVECSTAPGSSWGIWRNQGDITVANSVVCKFASGMYLATSQSGDQADVTNVTVAEANNYGIYVASGDTDITNSILAGSTGTTGLAHIGGNLTHSSNLVHGFTTLHSGTSASATDVLEPPRFADATNGDFHLAAGSPAINTGQDVSAILTVDLDGNSRPSFGAFEIGAYEFTGSAGSFSVLDWVETE